MCLLDCEQFFNTKICKWEYLSSEVARVVRAQIRIRCSNTIAYKFSSKRETDRSLYVFQCLQTFLLFSDRGNWRNNNTSNHEFSFKMSVWPCHGINSGENNVQAWQIVQVLYFGAREHWEECDQLSDTHVIVKGLNPGVISKVEWAWSSGST